jgi:hypothetical protein
LVDGDDQRGLIDDPRPAVHSVGELRERRHAVPGTSLGDVPFNGSGRRTVKRRSSALQLGLDLKARVPDVHGGHAGKLPHRLAVPAHALQDRLLLRRDAVAVVAGRDDQARGQPLEIPLPRPRERLVEVIDVEDKPTVR